MKSACAARLRSARSSRVLRVHLVAALVGEGHLARALVDREVELLAEADSLLLAHLAEHLQLHVLVQLADVGVLEHVEHLLVLRHGVVDLVYLPLALLLVSLGESLLGLCDEVVALHGLHADDGVHERLHGDVLGARRDCRRAADDERRARLVDEDGVHLVHDGEVVPVLHHLLRLDGHAVVAEVVEAELAVRAVGDVAGVLGAAFGGIHRVLDAAHGEAEVLVEVAHPRGVAAREVVVHRDELHVLAGERVEVEGKGGDEGLALACLHLRDLALMEHDAAHQLAVEWNHVPGERVAADLLCGAHEVAAGVLDEGERLRQEPVERDLLGREATLELRGHAGEVLRGEVLRLVLGLDPVDLGHDRTEPLEVARVLRPKDFLQDVHRKPRLYQILAVRGGFFTRLRLGRRLRRAGWRRGRGPRLRARRAWGSCGS